MKTPWGDAARGRRVRGTGPTDAPIVFLGEAPGKDEERMGIPFVGAAGKFLFEGRDWNGPTKWRGLRELGFGRDRVRIENVCELRPPDNQLWKLSPEQLRKWQADCRERLSKLAPKLIVPLGNLALNTLRGAPLPLTKRGKWKMRRQLGGVQLDWRDKITSWRGSITKAAFPNGSWCKVIPVFHPANILRASDHFDVWSTDMERVLEDSTFPELRREPRCEHLVNPTKEDARQFLHEVQRACQRDPKHAVLVGDIETRAGGKVIDCFGFSVDETFSITFDTLNTDWAWTFINALLRHPIAKGWHFGLYDQFVLGEKGKHIENTCWDTHQMHHCLDPRDDHHLYYCASRDLRVRYWKHEGKEDGQEASREGSPKDTKRRHRYCGKDACYTRALVTRYRDRLRTAGLLGVYRDHYRRLSSACLTLTHTGLRVDERARREIDHRERGLVEDVRKAMATMAGVDLVAKKGLSAPRVNRYFYDVLKCKPIYRRGSGTRTADEVAVRRLMTRYKKARPMGQLVLDYRMHAKIGVEVRQETVDPDGRIRSRYVPTTKTGRLHAQMISRHPPRGMNAQNRDRHSDLRRLYVADQGHVLIEVDESQAEGRLVDGMSGTEVGLRQARALPGDLDMHVLTATRIYPEEEYEPLLARYQAGDSAANEMRQAGKRTRYACFYGMQGPRMAETTLVETEGRVVLDPDECQAWIETLLENDPSITPYQAWVRKMMILDGELPSSWGRPYYFKGLRLSKEDFKEGYAHGPQHEVGCLMNQWGFVALGDKLQAGEWKGARIVQQGHDSLLVSTPPRHAWELVKFLVESLSREREYPGAEGPWSLAMPIGVKLGSCWYGMTEWKTIPTKDQFTEELRRVLDGQSTTKKSAKALG